MVVRLVALITQQVFRLVLLSCRTSHSKDIELLVLRQEARILRRQVERPRIRPEERIVFAVLQKLRPVRERLSSLVRRTPCAAGTVSWYARNGSDHIG